jgi:hypothetical protein
MAKVRYKIKEMRDGKCTMYMSYGGDYWNFLGLFESCYDCDKEIARLRKSARDKEIINEYIVKG